MDKASKSWLQRLGSASSTPGKTRRLRWATFLVVLIMGAGASWAVFELVRGASRDEDRLQFEQQASQMAAELQTYFDLSLEHLLAIPPFFAASSEVTRQQFSRFNSPALQRHPSIFAFAFLPRVLDADRAAFEAAARDEGLEDFAIRTVDASDNEVPFKKRAAYFPLFFVEPTIYDVIGIDLGAHPQRGPYIERALAIDGPVATPPLSLIVDPEDVLSVMAFVPVRYASTRSNDDCDGIAQLALRIRPVVEDALGPTQLGEFMLTMTDPDAAGHAQLIHKNFPGKAASIRRPGWLIAQREIRFADQKWTLTLAPAEGSTYAPHRPPMWILWAGIVLSLLAAYSASAAIAIGGLRKQVDRAVELGQYRLGKKLGEGGMGAVYEAKHQMLARPAVIKIMRPDGLANDERSLSRFEREAQATAGLESPHTISIYDFGKTPDGTFYYVMERLHGTDLSTLVDRAGPLPPARTIHLLRQVCCSLAEAHQAGLIHRDVKPANIFICRQALVFDFVKVLDFGLVKAGARQQSVELTQAGTMLGTPLYMAPEMIKGQDVDGRADLYSLGCVAYWSLTGKPPFDADTITAVVASHLTEEPPSPRSIIGSGIPESLDGLIVRCMAKNPDDRPQSAEQLEEELASCSDQSPWTQEEARACWDQIDLTGFAVEASTRSPSDAATVEHVLKLPE